jgi:hypothetical protein
MYRTKSDILSCFNDDEIDNTERVANNTYKIWLKDGTMIIRLHHTNIITVHPNGNVTLSSGGWETLTTKKRLNTFIPHYLNNYQIIQRDYTWYLIDSNNPRKCIEFYDGITFNRFGEVID